MTRTNQYGQAIGEEVLDWKERLKPSKVTLQGQYCRLEPLDPVAHGESLFLAHRAAQNGHLWTYLPLEPFATLAEYQAYLSKASISQDPLHFAVIDHKTQRAVGTMALMRIDSINGVIEVGHITYSPLLQRTIAATEAQFLLMKYALDTLAYRRYEWKCDSLNMPSRHAAQRFGFSFEGIFRQAIVYKGRSRDTAWFSIIDREWPVIRKAFELWLAPENFDAQGQQVSSLSLLRDRCSESE